MSELSMLGEPVYEVGDRVRLKKWDDIKSSHHLGSPHWYAMKGAAGRETTITKDCGDGVYVTSPAPTYSGVPYPVSEGMIEELIEADTMDSYAALREMIEYGRVVTDTLTGTQYVWNSDLQRVQGVSTGDRHSIEPFLNKTSMYSIQVKVLPEHVPEPMPEVPKVSWTERLFGKIFNKRKE